MPQEEDEFQTTSNEPVLEETIEEPIVEEIPEPEPEPIPEPVIEEAPADEPAADPTAFLNKIFSIPLAVAESGDLITNDELRITNEGPSGNTSTNSG